MRFISLLVITLLIVGCGRLDRASAAWTGDLYEVCHDGVIYLQGTSGLTVKRLKNGSVATCS